MLERVLERSKTSGRADDNKAAVEKQIDLFKTKTHPVIEYYEAQGKVCRCDASKKLQDVSIPIRL